MTFPYPRYLRLLLALFFGLSNRLPELRYCGDRGRVQRVLAHVTPNGGGIERVFNSAEINLEAVFGRADVVAHVWTSILRSKTGIAESGGLRAHYQVEPPPFRQGILDILLRGS